MGTILSQCRIKQFTAAALLVSMSSATAWSAAQLNPDLPAADSPALVVPGYGPGIAGHVIEGPITPHCSPGTLCMTPFVDASVLMLDTKTRETVGAAVTNVSGGFLVTVPPGNYLVHVQTVGNFPRCPDVSVKVGLTDFTPVQITCR
jgi:hypothetical protein